MTSPDKPMLNRRNLLGAGVAAGVIVSPAAVMAAAPAPVKLSKVFPYLDVYLKIAPAQRSHFAAAYYFVQDGKPVASGKAFIVDPSGARTPLALGADGRALRLPTLAQLQTGTLAIDNPTGGKFGVRLELHAVTPLAPRLDAHDLDLAITECRAAVAKIAGALSFAAPKISSAEFVGAGSGQGQLADGRAVALPVAAGVPYYSPAKMAAVKAIVLAHAPSKILLGSKT